MKKILASLVAIAALTAIVSAQSITVFENGRVILGDGKVLEALRAHGRPEVFNSDQGSQFTSAAFTKVLLDQGITISMDGRGRALDNIFVERLWRSVKHEDVYLKGYATVAELTRGLAEYFAFYNDERPHQSLGNWTPNAVYADGAGGGSCRATHGASRAVPNKGRARSRRRWSSA